MKTVTLAALTLLAAGVVAAPAAAAPVTPGTTDAGIMNMVSSDVSGIEQVGKKRWHKRHHWRKRRHRWHDDDDFSFRFGFGFPFLAYGLAHRRSDCIGWWHRHYSRWHCHGQLVWD
jgi:hypothetical protein